MRAVQLSLLVASALALAACGTDTNGSGGADPSSSPDGGGEEVFASGIVMQSSADAPVEFCVGPIAESYPPQCTGPELAGAFSWDDVEVQTEGEVRWTDTTYYGVGTFDPDQGERGTFSLTQPLGTEEPEGYARLSTG
ncbi:hypothetical protein [Serinicoccus kebangsaanensis]|uniref:hypothetical protein n=1 Tax=Serinicoccus kebangsaanensis TaxID=2602069 RepID=UPI00124C20CC|nr:hypothetical protein [Serinicoccus kebangsaanensis]